MGKIALLVSRDEMLYQAHNILQEKKYEIEEMRVIQTEKAVMEARDSIANGASIIIARGLQASLIKQYTEIPVVEIVITAQEMALLVTKAKQIINKPRPVIAVVGFKNMFCDMSYFDTIYDIELRTYYAINGIGLRDAAVAAAEDEADLIIGGDTAVEVATEYKVPSLFLSIKEDSLRTAFSMAESMKYAMGVEKRNAAQMETLLDNSFDGVVKMDQYGTITDINPIMEGILEAKKEQTVGIHVAEIFRDIEKDKLEQVLTQGQETYSLFMKVKRTSIFAILAPVQIDGLVDGAILSCHKMMKKQDSKQDSLRKHSKNRLVALGNFQDIIQQSALIKNCIYLAKLYSQSDRPVLITGETGTEKRLLAQSIHNNSLRNDESYVEVHCDGLSEEAQLNIIFGEKGALARVQGGTILIEEIHKLSQSNQYRLYQLIRYKVRSENALSQLEPADVRVLVTAPTSLSFMVEQGNFREDLYYLLNGLTISVPPIRDRKEDLKQILADCIKESSDRYSRYHVLTNGAQKSLMEYLWKGNLLQIESFCERLILTANKRTIDEIVVNHLLQELYPDAEPDIKNERRYTYKSREAVAIQKALEKHGGSREQTAKELGISKATLWRHMKKYEIDGK